MKTALFLLAILGLSQGASLVQPVRLHEIQPKTSRALIDDLRDFLELIPGDLVLEIIINNLGDPQLQDVIVYIFSSEFAQLVLDVEKIPEYDDVVSYLEGAGLPVSEWIAILKEFLGITKFAPKTSRGLNEIVAEIISVIPVDEMYALYQDKLANNPEFADLINQLNSPTFEGFATNLANLPEIQRIAQVLRDMGVDIDNVIAAIKDFFGINWSVKRNNLRDLMDDLRDFLALIPSDQILEIIVDNLKDLEVEQVIAYLFSQQFNDLMITIGAIPEFVAIVEYLEGVFIVVSYLEGAGLPVSEWIAILKEFLGIIEIESNLDFYYSQIVEYLEGAGLPVGAWIQAMRDYFGMTRNTKNIARGVNDVIDQIIALIPFDDLKALYHEKKITSPAFAELVDQIENPAFRSLVEKIADNAEVQRLVQELRDMGVPIDAFLDLLRALFGFN